MAQAVVDLSSNAPENIHNAATVIGRGKHRRAVFNAIYTGKQIVKSAREIAKNLRMSEKQVLMEGKVLIDNHIVNKKKVEGLMGYEKIGFYHRYKKKILTLASSKKKLKEYPTKRNPVARTSVGTVRVKVDVRVPTKRMQSTHVTVDDIDNFAKVHAIGSMPNVKMAEAKFKNGVAKILGEHGVFKDWGGESRDLSSNQLKIDGKRKNVAFAFKGPGTTGKLTPGKMGVNGDQIQRLVRCPAEVFIVQYWDGIEDSVLEQLKDLVTLKAYFEDKELWYGLINGNDSARLIAAYPAHFGGKKNWYRESR
jgi:hypothetical protein